MPNSEDRITKYLSVLNQGTLFNELSEEFLERVGAKEFLTGVPVPIMEDDPGSELTTLNAMLNMARIIGMDQNFPYAGQYMDFINLVTDNDPIPVLLSFGAKEADAGNFELACTYFRTILAMQPKNRDALYLYARACKGAYEQEDKEEEYVGNFKAESLESFELLTMIHKDFDMGYYFLGYFYVNLGLYTKAKLTWDTFMELHQQQDELRDEIEERLNTLTQPMIIEQGCNKIMAGDYQGGIEILNPFMDGPYAQWWPLYFYLGVAEEALGNAEIAEQRLKKALSFTPSNVEVMQELVNLYQATGDKEQEEKYKKKIEIVSY